MRSQWLPIMAGMLASLFRVDARRRMAWQGVDSEPAVARASSPVHSGSRHGRDAPCYEFANGPPLSFYAHPLFGSSTTVVVYALATALHRRVKWLHGLLTTCHRADRTAAHRPHSPTSSYNVGGRIVSFFLGPRDPSHLACRFYKACPGDPRTACRRSSRPCRRGPLHRFVGGNRDCGHWTGGSRVVLLSMVPTRASPRRSRSKSVTKLGRRARADGRPHRCLRA